MESVQKILEPVLVNVLKIHAIYVQELLQTAVQQEILIVGWKVQLFLKQEVVLLLVIVQDVDVYVKKKLISVL